ncbi:MAG TPA: ethanolamine ammonia-lyase reactivating factor EutA [Chloroflexota bacterium]|nr:ethanolamine ammonia-lyase reactivating factor EutA [Chloroflexota bacterium]
MHDFGDGEHEHLADGLILFKEIGRAAYATVSSRELTQVTSVGIDVGSATAHLVFSRLALRRQQVGLASRYQVVHRETLARSPIALTPYAAGDQIAAAALGEIVAAAFREAGLTPEGVDTGALVITGAAAERANAAAIAALFAEQSGKFVTAVAGPHLEALLAAHGSGAVARSVATGQTLLHLDVGGATSKLSVVQAGAVLGSMALSVGARLVACDAAGRVTRLEPAGARAAAALGRPLALGDPLDAAGREALAERLAGALFQALARRPLDPFARSLLVTPPLGYDGSIDALTCSGGVAEYVYEQETRDFGDLGPYLGAAIRRRLAAPDFPLPLAPVDERIRATVIGAAQYTLQVSGKSIHVPRPDLLPLRSLPVVVPALPEGAADAAQVAAAVRAALEQHDLVDGAQPLAVAFRWAHEPYSELLRGLAERRVPGASALYRRLEPEHRLLRALAEGLVAALPETLARRQPLVVVCDNDVGSLLGRLLAEHVAPGADVVCLDEIELGPFDYIDVGERLPDRAAVPVVVKSLVFGTGRNLHHHASADHAAAAAQESAR